MAQFTWIHVIVINMCLTGHFLEYHSVSIMEYDLKKTLKMLIVRNWSIIFWPFWKTDQSIHLQNELLIELKSMLTLLWFKKSIFSANSSLVNTKIFVSILYQERRYLQAAVVLDPVITSLNLSTALWDFHQKENTHFGTRA